MWRIDAIAPDGAVDGARRTLAEALGDPNEAGSFIVPLASTANGSRAWGVSGVMTQEQRDALEVAPWVDVMWTVRPTDTDELLAASAPIGPEVDRTGWTWGRTLAMFGHAPVYDP